MKAKKFEQQFDENVDIMATAKLSDTLRATLRPIETGLRRAAASAPTSSNPHNQFSRNRK